MWNYIWMSERWIHVAIEFRKEICCVYVWVTISHISISVVIFFFYFINLYQQEDQSYNNRTKKKSWYKSNTIQYLWTHDDDECKKEQKMCELNKCSIWSVFVCATNTTEKHKNDKWHDIWVWIHFIAYSKRNKM